MSLFKNFGRINDALTEVVVVSAETASIGASRGKEKVMHSAMMGRMDDMAEFKKAKEESSLTADDFQEYASALQLGCIISK